jgi:hypothetical protein
MENEMRLPLCLDYDARMDEAQFRRLLQFGLGRAILHARDHDVRPFRDVIVDACLHCYAYDAQIEGTRASYMLDLLDLTPDKDLYYEAVLNALPGSGDDYDAMQRFAFAACLALDGNERAKRLMYESYNPGPKMGEGIGIEFLQVDGIAGLLFAAEKIGALLTATNQKVDLGWLLGVAGQRFGKEEVQNELRRAGQENAQIETFRLAAEAMEQRYEKPGKFNTLINAGYEELRPKLPELIFTWIGSWGERASEEDLEKAAHGLALARSPKEQHDHLRIFSRRMFPLDIQLLLSLVDVEQERVGLAAVIALSQIAHPRVRDLSFRLIDTRAKLRGFAIRLLTQNFRAGDHAIALHWFEAEEDLEVRHDLGKDLIDLWERYPDEETEALMLGALYEQGPCSFCRGKTVQWMIKRGALTEDLRSECAWDANDDVRDLVKGAPKQHKVECCQARHGTAGAISGPAPNQIDQESQLLDVDVA